jgi:hypothetical protein
MAAETEYVEVLVVVYLCVTEIVAVPPLLTVAVPDEAAEVSPQVTVPVRESPAVPEQVRVPVTV